MLTNRNHFWEFETMKRKLLNMSVVLFLFIQLTGCIDTQYQPHSDNLQTFKHTSFIVEDRYLTATNFKIVKARAFSVKLPEHLPSLSEYMQNKRAWSTWHHTLGINTYRIIGLVDTSTRYRIDKVTKMAISGMVITDITIMTGSFAGTKARL